MSPSTTTGNVLHSGPDLRRAETATSASQLEAYLQAAPLEQFPEIAMSLSSPFVR
jgi:hypothetical protein